MTGAARSGAGLPEVLDVAARGFAAVVEFRRAAASQLRSCVGLFYAVVAVFAVLADVLVCVLLPYLAQLTASAPTQQGVRPVVLERGDVFRVLYISGFVGAIVGLSWVGWCAGVSGGSRACGRVGGNTGGGAVGSAVDEVLKISDQYEIGSRMQ